MSDESKQMKISADVQLVEVSAQKDFLSNRVLLLSQVAHNSAAEIERLNEESATALELLRVANTDVEELRVRLGEATASLDDAQKELWALRSVPWNTETKAE